MFTIENNDYFMSKLIKKLILKLVHKKLNSAAISELKINDFDLRDISESELGMKINLSIIINKDDLYNFIEGEINRI